MDGWIIRTLIAASAAMLASCGAKSTGSLSEAPIQGPQSAQLAAYAANAAAPEQGVDPQDIRVTAVVDRANHTIALRNFTDEPLKDVDVWVNGQYVRRVPSLPARSGAVVHFGQFYDAHGSSLADEPIGTVSQVQLKVGPTVYNVMGPAYD